MKKYVPKSRIGLSLTGLESGEQKLTISTEKRRKRRRGEKGVHVLVPPSAGRKANCSRFHQW